jgi:GAF domain-containing protein
VGVRLQAAEAEESKPMDNDREAAAFFARVSKELMRQPQEATTFERVAERAVQVVPPCDHAGITLRTRRHGVRTVASTSELAEECDQLQYTLDEGPCLQAVWDDDSYLAVDLAHDARWPTWGPRAASAGIGSVLAIRLATHDETIGALNLYAERPGSFTPDDVDLALIFASHAADAMNAAQLVAGLQTAVRTRHSIGVAQGILMQRYDISMEQAFEVLRRYSSHANIKVRELADLVIGDGSLPDLADPDTVSSSSDA